MVHQNIINSRKAGIFHTTIYLNDRYKEMLKILTFREF